MRTRGVEYGPAFRRLLALWRGGEEALAQVAIPRNYQAYRLHPVVLDGAFQALAAALGPADVEGDDLLLPATADEIRIHSPILSDDALWVYARLRSGVEPSPSTVIGDIDLYDAAGRTIASVHGLRMRRALTSAAASCTPASSSFPTR